MKEPHVNLRRLREPDRGVRYIPNLITDKFREQ